MSRLIRARFQGVCPRCRQTILKGDWIDWEPGAGAKHHVCLTAPQPASEPSHIDFDGFRRARMLDRTKIERDRKLVKEVQRSASGP